MGYRTAWTNSTITSGTINVSIAPAAGEFLIAWAITDANDTLSSYSAGWTSLAKLHSSADNADLFVLYKIADGSETTVSFTTNSGNSMIAGCAAFSGIDTTTPLDVASVSFANSASSTTSDISITPVTNGAVLARVQCCDNGSTDATFTFTTTSGTTGAWTTRVDQHASYYDVALGTAEQTTAGALTNRCTTSVSGGRIGWLFALRPAASGTTYNDSLTESATVDATLANAATFASGLTESATVADSYSAGNVIGAALTESATLADDYAGAVSKDETLTESATLGDSLAAVQTFAEAPAESVTVGESFDGAQVHAEAFSEGLTAGDSLTAGNVIAVSFSESATLGESYADDLIPAGSYNDTISEGVTQGDAYASAQTHVAEVIELFTAGDSYAVTGGSAIASGVQSAGRSTRRRRVVVRDRVYMVSERDIPALLEAELLDRAPPVTAEVVEGPKPPRKRRKSAPQPVKTVEQVRETVEQIKERIEPDSWLMQALETAARRVIERLEDEDEALMLLLAA